MYFHLDNNSSLFPKVHIHKAAIFGYQNYFVVTAKWLTLILANEEAREQFAFKFNQVVNLINKSCWEPG